MLMGFSRGLDLPCHGCPQVFDVDRADVAEQQHQDRESDRRLGRGDREDEEHENLARDIVEVVARTR